jgi:hypothetical protein
MAEVLDSVFPGLGDELGRATAADQRSVALASARMALLRTGMRDPRIDAVDAVAGEGRFGESPEREALASFVDALDNAAWAMQESVHRGTATQAAYIRAFREARAVAALFCAIGEKHSTRRLMASTKLITQLVTPKPSTTCWAGS